ncbi:MAG: TrkH family potassium uptake protein [Clostridia bacterium]|nr:TrkH family potassium uptake protein [Clostridia bacterium]
MNYKMIINSLAKVVAVIGACMIIPLVTSLCFSEWDTAIVFAITMLSAIALGIILERIFRPKDGTIFSREGLIITALSWIVVSLVGAIPFVATGSTTSYIDALFETISGFTTTGATILTDVEKLSHGVLMWRSLTHFIGGMGVLVLMIAVTNKISERNIHILRAEMPGPIVDKITPRAKDTAKILYIIYVTMTITQAVLLLLGGMSLFDSITLSFGTAGTGGFTVLNSGIASYSPYCQWVIAIFMMLFGVNFNIYFLILVGKFTTAIKSRELWVYIGIVLTSTAVVCFDIFSRFNGFEEALRASFFQVTSIMSTTGYTTTDFTAWGNLAKGVLLILMFIGGCAGSTAGGIKTTRVILLFKMMRYELGKVFRPRTVSTVKFDGKKIDETTLSGVGVYFALYFVIIIATFFLLCFEPFSFETNFTVAVSCFNNVGPAFGSAFSNLAAYSPVSKIILSFAMLFGRLEIYPMLMLFIPSTWSRKR